MTTTFFVEKETSEVEIGVTPPYQTLPSFQFPVLIASKGFGPAVMVTIGDDTIEAKLPAAPRVFTIKVVDPPDEGVFKLERISVPVVVLVTLALLIVTT